MPPSITDISASPPVLWPPNYKMLGVSINYDVTARCGKSTCNLTVTSNEPLTGTTDWTVVDPHTVQLRSSRNGSGNGRIYTVTVACQDTRANQNLALVSGSEWNPPVMIGLRHHDVLARRLVVDRDPLPAVMHFDFTAALVNPHFSNERNVNFCTDQSKPIARRRASSGTRRIAFGNGFSTSCQTARSASGRFAQYVHQHKIALGLQVRETCVPQSYAWGVEAQVDWYEAYADLAGERVKLQVFAMRSMASGAAFHCAYLHATQQAFLEAHELAFAYFGGVFRKLRYDNLTSAVTKILRGRP